MAHFIARQRLQLQLQLICLSTKLFLENNVLLFGRRDATPTIITMSVAAASRRRSKRIIRIANSLCSIFPRALNKSNSWPANNFLNIPQRLAKSVALVIVFGFGKAQKLMKKVMPPMGFVIGKKTGAIFN